MTSSQKLGCLLLAFAVGGGCGRSGSAPEPAGASGSAVSDAPAEPPKAVSNAPGELPKDVYPESRNRLPLFQMEDLDEDAKKFVASFEGGREAVADSGPRSIRMYSPRVAEYMTRGNQYLRYQAGLDPKLRELAILIAARAMDQQYEWAAHEKAGQKAELPQHVIDIVKYGTPITGVADEKQAILIHLGRELLSDHHVSSETFARALELFGRKGLVDIVSLVGHYTATAIMLTAFDQQLRPEDQPALAPLTTKPSP